MLGSSYKLGILKALSVIICCFEAIVEAILIRFAVFVEPDILLQCSNFFLDFGDRRLRVLLCSSIGRERRGIGANTCHMWIQLRLIEQRVSL